MPPLLSLLWRTKDTTINQLESRNEFSGFQDGTRRQGRMTTTAYRYRDGGASKCHMLRHCGRPKTTIAALFLCSLFPSAFPILILIPIAFLICACLGYSMLLFYYICHRYIYSLQLPHSLAPSHTHTSIYSCNQLGHRLHLHLRLLLHLLLLLALHFIYCLRFANSLPCSELRSSSSSPSLQMCWSSAANLMH